VLNARQQIARICGADITEVIFTSGATESNNLALFGLLEHAQKLGKNHIVSTSIEHKAILDPLAEIKKRGFKVTLVDPTPSGHIQAQDIVKALTKDTFLISCMHANNETGSVNNIAEIAAAVKAADSEIFVHSDCAQTFAKTTLDLQSLDIDMISFSGHKFFGPKGIGGLIIRKNDGVSLPLKPIMFGGGQERGLRPGTLPVHLIAGVGLAAELAAANKNQWSEKCLEIKGYALAAFKDIDVKIYGSTDNTSLPNTLFLSFGSHAESVIICLKDIAEISTGSACSSESYSPSHVLIAMGVDEGNAKKVVRLSWGPDTNPIIFQEIKEALEILR
jgi:cysteine desulfurase